ncbi:hypothetical protein PCL_11356 [Purpureocillium lilacinum]|uniref:Endonuclease/exonuclease/phosphatase domain-containing protein n=1 Tax=Purpureocillium lilacinum TaxID=33203 RepID=A0A2U3DPR5_PURLI|nr:hypothetical protein PCL_11356 [Purpureocillium lilacinum]
MASATSLHANSDPFDLGAHTPPNLARLARASQLRDSSRILTRPIGLSSTFRAAATEGAPRGFTESRAGTAETDALRPVSIIDATNKLAGDEADAHNAKMTVFRAFCESFEQTAKQFTSGLEHRFAEHFSNRFLDLWRPTPSDLNFAPAPTYSRVVAGHLAGQPPWGHAPMAAAAPQQQEPQQSISRHQGRPIPAPPKEDLRCVNCLGPHTADSTECPARPIRSHGVYRRLTQEEKNRARKMGEQLYAQRTRRTEQNEPGVQRTPRPQEAPPPGPEQVQPQDAGTDARHGSAVPPPSASQQADGQESERRGPTPQCESVQPALSPAVTMSPPCIRVITVEEEALQLRQPLHIITMRRHRNSQTGRKIIRVFQADVGKIPPAHDCALALADAEQYDVVLLQEPWTEAKEGRCLTKTHPVYDTFSPVDSWTNNTTRPRVTTYVRRRPGLTADQRRPATTRDILWLTINNTTIVNCYRQPDFDEALDILLAWSPPSRCLETAGSGDDGVNAVRSAERETPISPSRVAGLWRRRAARAPLAKSEGVLGPRSKGLSWRGGLDEADAIAAAAAAVCAERRMGGLRFTHIADKLGIDRSRIPRAHPYKTGWAIRAADLATRDLLTERQTEWASDISAEIVETRQEWYKYAVQGCPRRLNNIFGEAIDDEKAIRDEVATQTGQTPVMVMTAKEDSDQSPTRTLIISFAKEVKHYWRLFDTTSYARRITKTRLPKQCDNCWDYHSRYRCGRQPRCKNCGRIGHALDTCTATQQCANCRGPHAVDFSLCPARPKKINGVVRSLNRPEKDCVRRVGLRLFQQHTTKPASSPPREVSSSPESQSATASDTTLSSYPNDLHRLGHQSSFVGTQRKNEYVGNGLAPPASPSPSARSSLSLAPSMSTPTPPLTSTCRLGTPAPEHRDKRPFRVFQANVGKNGPSHDCALALADAERYEVILLQEPWTQVRGSRCLTKTHPAYDTYSPVSTWEDIDTRPRVMTYIRRGARLLADQQRPALSRDILWIVVNGVTLVNVYREPDVDTALEVLFAWPIPSQCIIAGDFNARHHTWQVGPSRGHGGHIAEWAAENDLALLNPINTPTNAHGNTIDLAFSNILLAEATVEDHLATSSDHFTLSISLPALNPATLPPGKILLASDEELKRFTELVVSGPRSFPRQLTTTAADLDQLADAIIDLIQSAARAAGRRSQRRPRKAPWWNEECAASVAELRCVRRAFPLGFNRDVQLARRDLRRIVRRAKQEFRRNLIDRVQSDKDVFKITRWLKRPGVFRPPPLQVGETIIETQIGKAEALRHATLERGTADDDISDPWTPTEDNLPSPFSPKVPFEEVQNALLRTGNTSPGSDNITLRLVPSAGVCCCGREIGPVLRLFAFFGFVPHPKRNFRPP